MKFSAKGKNLYKFINGIHRARIYCFNQYCKSEVFYGEVYKKNLPLIEQLAQKHGISLEIFEYETLVSKLKKYRLRFGIAIGILAFMFACFYFSNTVMTIEVNGNSRVKESVILSVLNDMGVKKGTCLNDINYSKCERELRIRIDKISWTAIRRTGNRIVVDV
ncbi:MAG TPA: sporulation protein YqfD, partial [Ruminococcus sp.]|nr:sporulation protein YqfD [Ruminococcus sp.]